MALLLACLCLVAAPEVPKDKGLSLGAGEAWYRDAAGEEATFEGILERVPAESRVATPTRYNVFRLRWTDGTGKPASREVYAPGKAFLLADHIGKKVRLVGKKVDTEADGKTYPEIWAARLELVTSAGPDLRNADGIRARCYWQPAQAQKVGVKQFVFRSGDQLIPYLGLRGSGDLADVATGMLAKRLALPEIDWKKYMLVTISAGLKGPDPGRLTVTRVVRQDDKLTVYYRLVATEGEAASLACPNETVLVDRCDGEVRIEQEETPDRTEKPDRP